MIKAKKREKKKKVGIILAYKKNPYIFFRYSTLLKTEDKGEKRNCYDCFG